MFPINHTEKYICKLHSFRCTVLLRCRVGAPRVGGGDGQKQVGTDGDFVGEKLAHAHQLRPPRRHGVDLGRGNVAWCLGQIAKNPPKIKNHKIRE